MKALKIVGGLVVALVLVVVVVVVLGLQNLNKIVKYVVETQGSEVTQTDVRLSQVNIQLKDGRGELSGLTIANPKGFSGDNIFNLGKVVLDIDPQSVLGDVKVIDEITIANIAILAEHKGLKDTNLQALLNNLKSSGSGGSPATESEPAADQASEDVLLAVKKVVFADNSVLLRSEKFGDTQFKIPGFELKNLGSKEQGLTPNELAVAILKPLLTKATQQAKEEIEDKLEDKAKEKVLDKLDDDQKEKLNELKSLFN